MIAASMFRASPRHQPGKPSEPDGVNLSVATSDKKDGDHKPRNKEVNFRYRSPAASPPPEAATPTRRFPSPNFGRTPNVQETSKRATSAERRRPVGSPARASNNTLAAALGSKRLWPSSLSISSSMQSDTSSISSISLGSGRFGSVKDKHERQASDHTLKPAGNGVRRSTEQSPSRKSTPEKKPTPEKKDTSERKGSPERKDSPRRKATTPERKRTPVRRAIFDQAENARPLENNHYRPDVQRWPGATTKVPAFSNTAESSKEKQKVSAEATTFLPQARSIITVSSTPPSLRSSVSLPSSEELVQPASRFVSRKLVLENRRREESDSGDEKSSDRDKEASEKDKNSNSTFKHVRHSTDEAELASTDSFPAHPDGISDSDSVSSGSSGAIATSGLGSVTPASGNKVPIGGSIVPGRSWQEQGKVRRLFEGNRRKSSLSESDFLSAIAGKALRKTHVASSGPPSSTDTVGNGTGSPFTAWASSARRSVSISLSNSQGPATPTVPAKPIQSSSPSPRFPSPTKPRGATSPNRPHRVGTALLGSLSFRSELIKGRQAIGQYDEALLLRILHNRLLQWRFVNASTEAAMNAQSAAAEKLLYNAWIQTDDLQASVFMNTIQLQQARQAAKLDSLISSHGQQLEECESLQQEHSATLFGVREALSATILKVPVSSGARADVQAIREAFGSVLDIMNSLDLLVRRLEPKSGRTSSLMYELTEMASQEISSLHECVSLLEKLAELEMEERSLKSHSIQLDLPKRHRPAMDSYVDMR